MSHPASYAALALLAALPVTAFAGDCPEGVELNKTAEVVEPLMGAAESVIAEQDARKLKGRMSAVKSEVGCLGEVAPPLLAARYHRLRAVQTDPLGVTDDNPALLGALRTAKALDPEYAFPAELLPADHSVRLAYDTVAADELVTERVRAPRAGSLAFDGTEGLDRPANGATLFQRLDEEGAVVETAWVSRGEPLPTYEVKPVLRNSLLATTVGLALGAGGLYAGALIGEKRVLDEDQSRSLDELESMRRRTNAMFISSIGIALVAGGAGVGAAMVGPR